MISPVFIVLCICFVEQHVTASVSSNDDGYISGGYEEFAVSTAAYPCPDAEAISPCFCFTEGANDLLYLDCSNIISDQELSNVFQQDFPDRDFYEFRMNSSNSVNFLNFTLNGKRFQRFNFYPGPFSLSGFTDDFFRSSFVSLTFIFIQESQITNEAFPFDSLATYPQLYYLLIDGAALTSMPKMNSSSIGFISFVGSNIMSLEPGSLTSLPGLYVLELTSNSIVSLEEGTLPIHRESYYYFNRNIIQTISPGVLYDDTEDGFADVIFLLFSDNHIREIRAGTLPLMNCTETYIGFGNNEINVVEPSAFYILTEPPVNSVVLSFLRNQLTTVDQSVFGEVMKYVKLFELDGNPLSCDCEMAWLITDPSLMDKISRPTTCDDGIMIHSLDPQYFIDNC